MNIGRIIKGIGGLYYVAADTCIYKCKARGIFRKNKMTPTVGDYVEISVLNEDEKEGTVEKILPRKNLLVRPRVANIDCAVITFAAASPSINFDLLDRFIVLAEYNNIENIVICVNKTDLNRGDAQKVKEVYSPLYNVVLVSAAQNKNVDELLGLMRGKVSVLAGPSGVGKTSLINALIPNSDRQTGEISRKIERGKHTTRQVELLQAETDTYIVDSPGFTSLELNFLEADELHNYFKEFKPYEGKCRFNDCRHIAEPDCAVKEMVGKTISNERYERFVYLYNELKQRR